MYLKPCFPKYFAPIHFKFKPFHKKENARSHIEILEVKNRKPQVQTKNPQVEKMTARSRNNKVRSLLQQLEPSSYDIGELKHSIEAGLKKGSNPFRSLKFFPTHVTALPTGQEKCDCLVIDLGGTNLRCIRVKLQPGSEPLLTEQKSVVPKHIKEGSGEQLFR